MVRAAVVVAACWQTAAGLAKDRSARADALSRLRPAQSQASVASLAASLTDGLDSEEERARAIFRWIAENVSYSAAPPATSLGAEDVLRQRLAACEGYASLFAALARAAGLQAEVIRGISKGFGYRAGGSLPSKPDHAWNAVKIGDRWRLVDCTWGAGYLDESGRFRRFFNAHYFLTPPEEFIFDHFPEDPRWQLLSSPLSREEYRQLVMVRPPFFRYGLRAISHPKARVSLKGSGCLTVGVPAGVALVARLYSGESEVPGTRVFVRRGRDAEVLVNPPAAGAYRLRLFAKECASDGPYEWAAEYSVLAEAAGGPEAYPQAYEAYYRRPVCLDGPVHSPLRAGQPVRFRIRVPEAGQVAVVSGDEWTFLEAKDGWSEGTAVPQPGALQVVAGFPGSDRFEVLLTHDVQ